MLGIKLMATGSLLMFLGTIFIMAIGEFPGPVVGAPIVLGWIGGAAMFVSGLLIVIWM